MNNPDFIIIGAMKSATSTLHEQLAKQSGFYMSTPKEPNFFSDDSQYALGDEWYDSLFEGAKQSDICGESSTHYTKLPDYPHTLERMAKRLNKTKFIYVMRHPVDRLISHYIHQWTQNVINLDINQAIDEFEELVAYSSYTKQLAPYFQQYGYENVLPVFTESLRVNPQNELDRIAKFLGHDKPVVWQEDLLEQNVSSERVRKFKGYRWLVDSTLMTFFRRTFIPKSFREKVKQTLTLKKRPEIDSEHMDKLISVFDKDLGQLGEMLGVELNCESYKKLVSSQQLNWSTEYWNRQ